MPQNTGSSGMNQTVKNSFLLIGHTLKLWQFGQYRFWCAGTESYEESKLLVPHTMGTNDIIVFAGLVVPVSGLVFFYQ